MFSKRLLCFRREIELCFAPVGHRTFHTLLLELLLLKIIYLGPQIILFKTLTTNLNNAHKGGYREIAVYANLFHLYYMYITII